MAYDVAEIWLDVSSIELERLVREYPRPLEARPPLTQAKVNYREWLDPSLGAWPAGKGHVVPLSDWAIEELEKLKVMADRSRYVLPNADQSGPADPKSITRSVARCLKRFKKHGVGTFTPHDLRRTGRTGLARLGVKVDIAERVLNHARERLQATCDLHDYVDEKREALDRWAKYLAELRDGQAPAEKRESTRALPLDRAKAATDK